MLSLGCISLIGFDNISQSCQYFLNIYWLIYWNFFPLISIGPKKSTMAQLYCLTLKNNLGNFLSFNALKLNKEF